MDNKSPIILISANGENTKLEYANGYINVDIKSIISNIAYSEYSLNAIAFKRNSIIEANRKIKFITNIFIFLNNINSLKSKAYPSSIGINPLLIPITKQKRIKFIIDIINIIHTRIGLFLICSDIYSSFLT